MRYIVITLLLAVSFIITACGGGGGGSSSSKVGVSLDMNFENARAASDGFYISNTKIESVLLSYTDGASSTGSLDVTSAAESGTVELDNLNAGSTYTFTITATSEDSVDACTGSTSVTIVQDKVVDAELECVFIDEYAAENNAYELVKLILTDDFTSSSIGKFVSTSFTTHNGMSRSDYISDLEGFNFLGDDISVEKVDVEFVDDEKSRAGRADSGAEALLSIYFTDGTVFKEFIWMVEENGEWFLTGNGEELGTELEVEAMYTIPADENSSFTESFYSGLHVDFYDPADVAESILMSGSGLTQDYYTFSRDNCTDGDCDGFYLHDPYQTDSPEDINSFVNLFSSATSIENNPDYSLDIYFADNSEKSYTKTAYGKPISPDDLNKNYFVTITSPTSQYYSEYIDQESIDFTVKFPTAYTAQSVEIEFDFSDDNGNYEDFWFTVPLNSTKFTVDSSDFNLDFTPSEGYIYIIAYDSNMRRFTTVYEMSSTGSSATTETAVSDTSTALSDSFSTLGSSSSQNLVTILGSGSDSSVQNLMEAISDGADSGLSVSEIQNAMDAAGMKTTAAYDALVDAFMDALTLDSTVITAIISLINDLTDAHLAAIVTIVKQISDNDIWSEVSSEINENYSSIITEITEATTDDTATAAQALTDTEQEDVETLLDNIIATAKDYSGDTGTDATTAMGAYFATDFGLDGGSTRAEVINDLLEEGVFELFDSTLSYSSLDVVSSEETDVSGVYEISVKFNFSDGSYTYEVLHVTQESSSWVMTGDEAEIEFDMFVHYIHVESDDTDAGYYSGLMTEFYDNQADDTSTHVNVAQLAGSGLSLTYAFDHESTCEAYCDELLLTTTQSSTPEFLTDRFVDMSSITSPIDADEEYTLTVYYNDTTPTDTFTYTAENGIKMPSEITDAYYPTIDMPDGLNLANYIDNVETFDTTMPTEYTVAAVQVSVELFDSYGEFEDKEGLIDKTSSSVEIDFPSINTLSGTIQGAYIAITAISEDGEVFTTVYEMTYDESSVSESDEFLTTAYTSGRSISGYDAVMYDDGSFVLCNSGTGDTDPATLFVGGDSAKLYGFSDASYSDPVVECYSIDLVTDDGSSYYGYAYITGETAAGDMSVTMLDDSQNVVWSKEYSDSNNIGFEVADATVIGGVNLLLLGISDSYLSLAEIDASDGSVVNTTTIISGVDIDLNAVRIKLDDESGMFLIAGSYIDNSSSNDFYQPLVVIGSFSYNSSTLMYDFSGVNAYTTTVLDTYSETMEAEFEDADVPADGVIVLTGFAEKVNSSAYNESGNLLVTIFETTTGTFTHNFFDNSSADAEPVSDTAIANDGTYMYLVANTDDYAAVKKFSYVDGTGLVCSANTSIYDTTNDIGIYNIMTDDTNGLLYMIGDYGYDTLSGAVRLVFGAMNTESLDFDGTSFTNQFSTGYNTVTDTTGTTSVSLSTSTVNVTSTAAGNSVTETADTISMDDILP